MSSWETFVASDGRCRESPFAPVTPSLREHQDAVLRYPCGDVGELHSSGEGWFYPKAPSQASAASM